MKDKSNGKKDNRTICATDREHFRALLENHPLPAFIVDLSSADPLQYTFLAANKAAQLLYGYTEEEFLQMTLTRLRPEEDLELYVAELKKAGTETVSFQTSTPHRHLHDKQWMLGQCLFEVEQLLRDAVHRPKIV